jgi:DNA helicase-2/ATP-dependent DNA helicase PcrA
LILNFPRDYKKVKDIFLIKNYRSTKKILKSANRLIQNNSSRVDFELITDNEDGIDIVISESDSSSQEAKYVADTISSLLKDGFILSDIAILYRNNSSSSEFEH